MKNEPMQVVAKFLTAVQQGDAATFAELIHPEIEWVQPGNNRFTGTKKSANEVFELSGGFQEISGGTFRLDEIKAMGSGGNNVACLLHFTGNRPGADLDVDNVDVYTVEDGKITRALIFSLDQDHEDTFWGK